MASLLPLPDDPRLTWLIDHWPISFGGQQFPRSHWLSEFETVLREWYPQSSSRDRKLTARHYAPFWLKDGHDVP